AGEDASLDRQQAARRDPKGSGHAGDSGKTGETRRPAATDERRAIRTVRPRRSRKDGEARQGREHPADELIRDPSPGRPARFVRLGFFLPELDDAGRLVEHDFDRPDQLTVTKALPPHDRAAESP